MEFFGSIKKVNFGAHLQPLFDAMMRGETIKKVVCMAGSKNENDRSKDITFEDFKAEYYSQGAQINGKTGETYDYVDIDKTTPKGGFYMSWVISFEL